MDVVRTVAELRVRLEGEASIALVPTMGNLHDGHMSLVDIARGKGKCVVASIFVNRLQFEPGGDFDRYPRTFADDRYLLEKHDCDVLFAPDEHEMYPVPQEIHVTPPKIAAELDGLFRPGHFQGVVTVVSKLWNLVRPQVSVFGRKDYQQLAVLRALNAQLDFGIEIVGAETVRETDGLAMSSRNGYLSKEERAQAPQLHRELAKVKTAIEGGSKRYQRHEELANQALTLAGWDVDYVAVRNQSRLAAPAPADTALVVLAAARLGRTRLIDNLEISAGGPAPR
jgi:pantoate--beta-alanine ligase